ncbi:hypothetical protein [Paenibacillus macerans]|uniref:ABC transporter permease/M1 family aminopeptidase n=1 Tax=Paenibacillus macerans TaxID=44252 RepID=UPI003D31AAFC
MRKWQRLFQFELRLLFGNWWLPAVQAVFALLAFWNLGRPPGRDTNFFREAYTALALLHTMSLGLTMLLGVLAVRRDVRRPAYEWSAALPVSYAARMSAKYAAGLLYFTVFSLLAGAAFAWSSSQTGVDPALTREYAAYFLLTYEISYLVTFALAMLLAVCIANRAVYLIAFCAWMFGTFFMDMFLLDRNKWYGLSTFHLSRLFVTGDMDADTWGIRLIADELAASRWFVLAFTLLLLTAGVVTLNRLRPTGHRNLNWAAGGLALALAAGAFVPYGLIWRERGAGYQAKLHDPAIKTVQEVSAEKAAAFTISNYTIDLAREPDDRLKAKVELQIPAGQLSGDLELPFTLNRAFRVGQLKVAGASVPFTQEGEALTAKLAEPLTADKAVSVEMEYTGRVMDYTAGNYTQGAYLAFVKGQNVLLPGFIAWYPLAGHRSVYAKGFFFGQSLEAAADLSGWSVPPADFRVNVSGFASKLYGNLEETEPTQDGQSFAGKSAAFVRLYGGDFEEISRPEIPVRIVTTPYNTSRAEKLLDVWKAVYDYYTGWVDPFQPKLDQVLMFSLNNNHSRDLENKTYYLIWEVTDMEYYANQLMDALLLGTNEGDPYAVTTAEDVRPQIRALMWYIYYREVKGLSHEDLMQGSGGSMTYPLYDALPETDPDRVGPRLAEQVGKALDEGKTQQVKEVLNHFYGVGLEIPRVGDEGGQEGRILYADWEREWKKVMDDADAS